MFCPACGTKNPDESTYCGKCGAYLGSSNREGESTTITLTPVEADVEQEEDIQIPDEELQPGVGMLVVKRGPSAGTRFLLDKDLTTSGRHPESDIFLDDITVSRTHAIIEKTGDEFKITDKGSLNGTYVNKMRVDSSGLENGDEVQIGKFRLVFFTK
ncbi:MAG: zinc-ribbon and FHA domain-containing protein [Actinobacteria bacterium]|nr:zinc-ribbon and FHA domain-containing protein [Actinomycetota bacterium]